MKITSPQELELSEDEIAKQAESLISTLETRLSTSMKGLGVYSFILNHYYPAKVRDRVSTIYVGAGWRTVTWTIHNSVQDYFKKDYVSVHFKS